MWLKYLGLEPTVENFLKLRALQAIFADRVKKEALEEFRMLAELAILQKLAKEAMGMRQ